MKKALILLLCAALLLALPPAVFAEEAPPPDAPSSEAGAGGAIPITDRAGLEAMAHDPTASYVLMADIDMGGAPWKPIAFVGRFDGGGHTLYNLTIREVGEHPAVSVDGNQKDYVTHYAALFSRAENAVIQNLHLLNVDVDITTDENCFASGLVGYAENTEILNCSVRGRVALNATNWMCGVAGIAGFGWGTATNCDVDVTLTVVNVNEEIKCEQFLGGVLATGYMDVAGCIVTVRGFASVHGYVHNGGVVGMYYVHTADGNHPGYVNGCTVDAVIDFFENNEDRRAYCAPVVGEELHWPLTIEGNVVDRFENNETTDYATILLPEKCQAPAYAETVTPPGCDGFGYTTYTCATCTYSYTDDFVAPAHQLGDWEVVQQPANGEAGLRARVCQLCGQAVEQEPFYPASDIVITDAALSLRYKQTAQITATIQPESAAAQGLVYASSNEEVATVDEQGVVTATGRGAAVITCASADGNATAECPVAVSYSFGQWLIVILLFGWIWY